MISFDRYLSLEHMKDVSSGLLQSVIVNNEILNCHMVDFITENHFSSMLNDGLKRDILGLGLELNDSVEQAIYNIMSYDKHVLSVLDRYPCLKEFVKHVTDFNLDTVASKITKNEKIALGNHFDNWWMKQKKNHEVQLFSNLISSVTSNCETHTVIDFGCGKGYLSTDLSLRHKLKVLGLDCSDTNTHSAQSRHSKFVSNYANVSKKKDESLRVNASSPDVGQFISVTKCINMDTDLQAVLHDYLDDEYVQRIVLCGLHTCGDLGSTILKQFLADPRASGLCYVGCCYHLIQEEFAENPFVNDCTGKRSWGFPLSKFFRDRSASLGRNARMLSSQSWQRLEHSGSLSQNKALFYRAVLQAILKDLNFVPERGKRVGKIALKCKSFVQYFRKGAERLGFSNISITDEEVLNLFDKYKDYESKLSIFQGLRVILAPIVEAVVIMDRILLLLEDDGVEACHLVKVFDPVISPRCYAIIAFKKQR